MFDGKIDFMDFNKIKINYGGKLTCRKIFKKKYIIFLILSIICLLVLIYFYTVKNKNITNTTYDIESYKTKKLEVENNYNIVKNRNTEEEMDLNKFRNQINVIKNDIQGISKQEDDKKKLNKEIKAERDKLEKQSTSLSLQYKAEYGNKYMYEQRIASLTTLLHTLKTEYEQLKQKQQDKEENILNIRNSKIVASGEAFNLEKTIGGTIGDKCFDGPENNYSPKTFHENCDNNALLILIKTDDDKRIGAFIRVSSDGLQIKTDPSSLLINIDTGKYYGVREPDYATIVCDPNELPQIGVDLKIKTDGKGINMFPLNYGTSYDSSKDMYRDRNFTIKNLEIYKVLFK